MDIGIDYWRTADGLYDIKKARYVAEAPKEAAVTPLYSDTSDPGNLILAGREYLRETVLFYGLGLGEDLKNRLDKIRDIQAEYAPQLTELQEARAGAEMRDDAEDVAAIKAEYVALLQEMNDKIQEVPGD